MVGGDEAAYRAVEPLLRELGTPNYVGENGQGLALKLAINISLAVQMLAFAEGLLLAERSGVDRQRALEIMEASPIGSPMLRARSSIILDPPAEAWFDLGFMHKDIELALDTARKLQIPLPTAERTDEILERAEALGYEHRDLAALFQALEQIADGGG
jgi:3-hydroxyisobutyrate dehydrogenase-like beta-hydroxyacid dehydrogenase